MQRILAPNAGGWSNYRRVVDETNSEMLTYLQAHNAELLDENEGLKLENNELTYQVNTLAKEPARLSEQIARLSEERSRLEKALALCTTTAASGDCADARGENDKMRAFIKQQSAAISRLERENAKLRAENAQQYEDCERMLEENQGRMTQLRSAIKREEPVEYDTPQDQPEYESQATPTASFKRPQAPRRRTGAS